MEKEIQKQETLMFSCKQKPSPAETPYLSSVLREFKQNPNKKLTLTHFTRKFGESSKTLLSKALERLEYDGRINIGNDIDNEPTFTLNVKKTI